MRKYLCAALAGLGLLLSACYTPAHAASNTRNDYFMNLDTIGRISCLNGSGTGIIIAHDRVLTANHVVFRDDACSFKGKPVEVIYSNALDDVAVLKVDLGDTATTPVSCEGYLMDEPYLAIGFAAGEDFAMQTMFSAHDTGAPPNEFDYPYDVHPEQVLEGHAIAGMSGGPIIDLNGRLIGLVNAGSSTMTLSRDLSQTALCTALRAPMDAVKPVVSIKLGVAPLPPASKSKPSKPGAVRSADADFAYG